MGLAFRRLIGSLTSEPRKYATPDKREDEKRDDHRKNFDEVRFQPPQNLQNFIAEKEGYPSPEIIARQSRNHYDSSKTSGRIVQRARRHHENLERHRRRGHSRGEHRAHSPPAGKLFFPTPA